MDIFLFTVLFSINSPLTLDVQKWLISYISTKNGKLAIK